MRLITDIFAILFAAGRLDIEDICRCLQIERHAAGDALDDLDAFLQAQTPLMLCRAGDTVYLATRPEFASIALRIDTVRERQPKKLSDSALETLAVIAYRQPVSKEEIDRIRKADSEKTLATLQQAGLITAFQSTGRAHLYRTMPKFLEMSAIKSLSELPPLSSFTPPQPDRQTIVTNEAMRGPDDE